MLAVKSMRANRHPAHRPVRGENVEHISLVGFMGSGKSTVGRALAEKLGRDFIDIDDTIVRAAGCSIPEIFKNEGEVGFRARERAAVRDLLALETPAVIATGGGTFVDPKLRQALRSSSHTVFLDASLELISARLIESGGKSSRPMLSGPNPELTLRRLLKERGPAYRESEITIPVDGLDVDGIVERIFTALGLESVKRRGAGRSLVSGPAEKTSAPEPTPAAKPAPTQSVAAEDGPMNVTTQTGSYPIYFEPDAGVWIADAICARTRGRRIALVTDENVAALHVDPIRTALEAKNKIARVHVIPAGETSKSLGQASRLYDALLVQELDRNDAVVAVGGGVVGDLAGFVASTFLRGVDFIQVPTTTLACVDSSVGGKTGINTPRGKNLVGTFYPPKLVCIAGSHLTTLGPREHAAGIAESIKIAACLDIQLFKQLVVDMDAISGFDMSKLLPVLRRSVALKAHVVSQDEKERGLRAVLNYGHTIGHAIERGTNYTMLHGEAVALGMLAEAEWADSEGLSNGIAKAMEGVLTSAGLPTDWKNVRVDMSALRLDKKRVGTAVQMPVVTALGQFEFKSVPISAVAEFVARRSAG